MNYLELINEYAGLLSLILTSVGSCVFFWLTKTFYTKNEAEKDKIEVHTRLAELENNYKKHDLILNNLPSKEDFHKLALSIESLQGDIKANTIKYNALDGKIEQLITPINMLTEFHIKG